MWYRERKKSDEREEKLDKILRGERRIKRGRLETGERIEMAKEESKTHEGG